jgi:hypothetical protein
MGNYSLPFEPEIQASIVELFSCDKIKLSKELSKALLPEDPALNEIAGERLVSPQQLLPQREMQAFCKQLYEDILLKTDDIGLKTRIALCIYCHIMESDFMFTCLWNLLRVARGLVPSWKMVYEFVDKKGTRKRGICKYPSQKIDEIKRLSQISNNSEFKIGMILERLWNSEIRNSFSHSNYMLLPENNPTSFVPAQAITPNKRAIPDRWAGRTNPQILIDDIWNYCFAAITLMSEFNRLYNPIAQNNFQSISDSRRNS